jgi:hypothetical protein
VVKIQLRADHFADLAGGVCLEQFEEAMINWLRSLYDQWRIYNAVIDPNSKCPGCGARSGKLQCMTVRTQAKPNIDVQIEHQCTVCHAKWYEPTIVKPEKWVASELLKEHTPQQAQ